VANDPRTILDAAARARVACQLRLPNGDWVDGSLVRVDKAGVVVLAQESAFRGGEDVRVWFASEDGTWTFEASVLRAGVPVPDRSQNGLLLGFIDGFEGGAPEQKEAPRISVRLVPPNGRGLELVGGGVRLLDVAVDQISFTVPAAETLKFVEGGNVRLRFEVPGQPAHWVLGQVQRLAPGEGVYLYAVAFTGQGDDQSHLQAIEALRKAL
jgi:hypothetical protein